MTHEKNFETNASSPSSFVKPMIVGGGIAFVLISLFLFSVDEAKPEWGPLWMIRPFIIVPLAGATGGLCYHVLTSLASKGKLNKAVAVVLSVIVYFIGLWMGFVLGLDGTLWN